MTIRNILLLIILISLIVLAVYNYNAGRNLNLKANSHNSQFKECRKIANVSECNRVVEGRTESHIHFHDLSTC